MSTIVKNIHILKDGVWRPIKKVFHQGEWKKLKGIFYEGEWYEIGATCVVMPEGCAIATTEHPRWDESEYYGTNNLKLSILPSGWKLGDGGFYQIGNNGQYWTTSTSENIPDVAYFSHSMFYVGGVDKTDGYSVRAIKTYMGLENTGTILINDYIDGSGNYYDSVVIGNQLWVTKNLYSSKYQDGTNIEYINNSIDWQNNTDGAYCWYEYDYNNYGQYYGALYNWFTLENNIVNYNGYRVPSSQDWNQLILYTTSTNWCGDIEVDTNNVLQFLNSCRQVNHPLAV